METTTGNSQPKKKNKLVLGALGCVGLLFVCGIIAAMSGGANNLKNQPAKVGDTATNNNSNSNTSTPTESQTQTFYLNEQIKLDDKVLTVTSISDYKSSNQFIQPTPGNKFVVVDVTMENQGKDAVSVNPLEFKLQDNNNYSYQVSLMSDKTPLLSSEPIQPGRKVRGFITFEVPTNSTTFELAYTPNFFSNKQIIVKLEAKK
jgi:hypothetical protein